MERVVNDDVRKKWESLKETLLGTSKDILK